MGKLTEKKEIVGMLLDYDYIRYVEGRNDAKSLYGGMVWHLKNTLHSR